LVALDGIEKGHHGQRVGDFLRFCGPLEEDARRELGFLSAANPGG
jgi:hypothetical protein